MSAITVTQSQGHEDTAAAFQSVWIGGDTVANNGRTLLYFKNSSGSAAVATFDSPAKEDGLDIANPTLTVDNTADQVIGPFDPAIFNTAAGLINITYTGAGTNTTTVAAISL